MEDTGHPALPRFLVVTPNVLVGEDLYDILGLITGGTVDLRSSMEDHWGISYDAAFFGFPIETLMADMRVAAMLGVGTRLVIINGETQDAYGGDARLRVLAQPFRSEDVERLLSQMGYIARPV